MNTQSSHLSGKSWQEFKQEKASEILNELYAHRLILTWYRDKAEGWILRSGKWSPFYIQLRGLIGYPQLLQKIGLLLSQLIREEIGDTGLLIGLAMTGIPIATAISLETKIPLAFTRHSKLEHIQHKDYGQHRYVEGIFHHNTKGVLIDDVLSSETSKIDALVLLHHQLETLQIKNFQVHESVVLVDRFTRKLQVNTPQNKTHTLRHHALIHFESSGLEQLKKSLAPLEYEVFQEYFSNPEYFQDAQAQKKLQALSLVCS